MAKRRASPPRSNKIRTVVRAGSRMSAAPLARLKPHMDMFEYQAADEILAAFKMAAGQPVVRDPDLDIPLLPRADAADDHAAHRSDLGKAYPTWRVDLRDTVPLRVADAVLFHEHSLADIDASNRWRKGTARSHLATALKHFASLRGNVPRGMRRDWKFNPRKETK